MSNDTMGYRLYGYVIGKEVHFEIDNGRLYRLPQGSTEKYFMFGSVLFNHTMLQLFIYLLQHGRQNIVTKEELLRVVWEENDLVPSTQRLWQVLKNLNRRLSLLGLPEDFITSVRGSGYCINYVDITPIYYRVSELHHHPEEIKES